MNKYLVFEFTYRKFENIECEYSDLFKRFRADTLPINSLLTENYCFSLSEIMDAIFSMLILSCFIVSLSRIVTV